MVFKNLDLVSIGSPEEALEYLKKGRERLAASDDADNLHSARAHTVFTLWIENEIDGRITQSKLNMVDLAGSERRWKRHAKTGALQREAAFVNRSISVLSMVVQELRRKMLYVPCGDCKLTHFLKDSIGGNCRTLLIGCIFPDEGHLFDVHSTCRFAEDIQQIEVHLQKNNPGNDTSHATLFRVDPVAMKCMEKMTELRASQQMQRYLNSRNGRKAVRGAERQQLRAIKDAEHGSNDAALSQQLQSLKAQVDKYDHWREEWKEKKDGSKTPDLKSLQKRVEELEAKLSEGNASTPVVTPDDALEAELQELRAKVASLDNICYRRERDLEELQHFCRHVLNQRMAVPRTPALPQFQGIDFVPGGQAMPGMPGITGVQPMVPVQNMPRAMPGVQAIRYNLAESRSMPSDVLENFDPRTEFIIHDPGQSMQWGHIGQLEDPACSSYAVPEAGDVYTEARGYLVDPETSEACEPQEQWGCQQVTSPPAAFVPIEQRQLFCKTKVTSEKHERSSSIVGTIPGSRASEYESARDMRPRAKTKKMGSWKQKITELLGIGTQSCGSESQDDACGSTSQFVDPLDDLEHTQVGNGLVWPPTQPTTPDYGSRRSAHEYHSCAEPQSVFLNSCDTIEDSQWMHCSPSSQQFNEVPRLDLGRIPHPQ